MAANQAWQADESLESDLKKYVAQNLKRSEIVDVVKKSHQQYAWSLPTLDRRLREFNIKYVDKNTSVKTVFDAVAKELEGPRKLLRYRAMNQKLRTEYNIFVPRNLVANVVFELDPDGAKERNVKIKKKKPKKPFVSDGPG